jgi:SAM-dependent methyltransferase
MDSVAREPDSSLQPVPDRADVMARNEQAWEDWGRVDPLWAIVTDADRKNGTWDLDEFFRSGQEAIDSLLGEGAEYGVPMQFGRGLDFGCGVGRLTRAIGNHVSRVVGLDISSSMIDRARALDGGRSGLEFAVHRDTDLRAFEDGSVDVVCSLLVLQHIPSVTLIENYLREFVRVLAPGGFLMVNLPDRVVPPPVSWRGRIRARTRALAAMRRIGVSPAFLYRHFNWSPDMPMTAIPSDRVGAVITASGGRVLESRSVDDGGGIDQCLYLVTC